MQGKILAPSCSVVAGKTGDTKKQRLEKALKANILRRKMAAAHPKKVK